MKGSALAFSFITLIAVIGFGLVVIGMGIGFFTNTIDKSSMVISMISSIVFITLNAAITFGLNQQEIWAFLLGAIEMIIFSFLSVLMIWFGDLSSVYSYVMLLIFSSLMLLSLRREFAHVQRM